MIERVELKASTAEVQPIQSTAVRQISSEDQPASSHNEVLIHNTSLLGELHWTGTMNAFRVATAFEAQQQLLSMKDSDSFPEPKLDLNAQSRAGVLQVSHQSLETRLVRQIVELAEDQNYATALRGQSSPESRYQVQNNTIERTEVVPPFAAADGVAHGSREESKPTRRDRQDTDQIPEIGGRRLIYRGRLIRVGNTTQFVHRVSA